MFNIAAAVSLLLCVGTAVLWARTFWRTDRIQRMTVSTRWRVESDSAGLHTRWEQFPRRYPPEQYTPEGPAPFISGWQVEVWPGSITTDLWDLENASGADGRGWNFRAVGFAAAGWHAHYPASQTPNEMYTVILPHWFIVAVTAVFPALLLGSTLKERRHRRRLRSGHCPACGYDLRATPTRCPECGAVPAKAAYRA